MKGTAKYHRVKEQLERLILQETYPVGSQLPSEPELARTYNVSRGTIRQALSSLADDAIIARRSGSGTYVIRTPQKDAQILSFTEQVRQMGKTLVTKVLSSKRITAAEIADKERDWICKAFLVTDPEKAAEVPVYRIERLRYIDDSAVSWQELYLLAEDFRPDLLEVEDFRNSAFDIYSTYGRRVVWAEESIQARRASAKFIQHLEMNDLPPYERFIYIRRRVSYDSENLPVEAVLSCERHDCFDSYYYRIVEANEKLKAD